MQRVSREHASGTEVGGRGVVRERVDELLGGLDRQVRRAEVRDGDERREGPDDAGVGLGGERCEVQEEARQPAERDDDVVVPLGIVGVRDVETRAASISTDAGAAVPRGGRTSLSGAC